MIVQRTRSLNPLMRWKWRVGNVVGYTATKRGACTAARLWMASR